MRNCRQFIIAALIGAVFFIPGLLLLVYDFPSKSLSGEDGVIITSPVFESHGNIRGKYYAIEIYPRIKGIRRGQVLGDSTVSGRGFDTGSPAFGTENIWYPQARDAVRPNTVIVLAGSEIYNLIRIEWILMIVGAFIGLIPLMLRGRRILRILTRRATQIRPRWWVIS